MDPTPLRADLGDLIQSLVVFLFIFGPILSRVLGKKEEGAPVKLPPPRPRVPPPTASEGEPVSWKDLLAGRVERLPDIPEVEEAPPVQTTAKVEQPTSAMEKEASPPEPWESAPFDEFDSGDLVSEDTLAHVPSEEQLEQDFDSTESLGTVGESEIDDVLRHTEVATISRAHRHPILGTRGDMRRTVVMAEVLGRPLSLREEWNYGGPPSVRR